MCGGSGGGQTTVTNQIPEWVRPYAEGFLTQAGTVNSTPYEGYTGERTANLAPGQQSAIQGINNLASGGPGLYQAEQMLGETMSGQGLNPYLDNVVGRTVNQATGAYNSATNANLARFKGANRGGSSYGQAQGMLDQNFSRGLGDAIAPIYQSAYEGERGRQMQAAGQIGGLYQTLGGLQQNALGANQLVNENNQQRLNTGYNNFLEQRGYPTQQLNTYGNAVASMLGGAGRNTTQTTPGADGPSQGMGGLMLLGSLLSGGMFSDRRLKSNVERIGTHPLGIGVYEYDIFGKRDRGVMADEVLAVLPQAVLEHPSGYLMVNYAMLGGKP